MLEHQIKKFQSVKAGDHIYLLNPPTGVIIPLQVSGVAYANNNEYIIINYFAVSGRTTKMGIKNFVDEALKLGKVVPTTRLLVPKILSMVITANMPPLVYATTEQELEQWLKKS